MIEKMEKIYIYGLKGQSDDIMEKVMQCGVMEPTVAESMVPEEVVGSLSQGEGADLSKEEELLGRLENCIEALKEFGEKRGLLYKRPVVTYQELTDDAVLLETIQRCDEIEAVVSARAELQKDLQKAEFQKMSYEPWETLDVEISDFNTRHARLVCYVLPAAKEISEIEAAAAEKEASVILKEISSDAENKYIAALFHVNDQKAVRETFGVMGGKEFNLDGITGTFKENKLQAEEKIQTLQKGIEAENEKLKEVAGLREQLEMACDAIKVRMDCLGSRDNMLHTGKVDIVTGWVVASKKEKLNAELDKFTCSYEYVEPEKDEEYPVLMTNSKIVAPFGALTEMYSLPYSRSMDSNWAIGLFFFIFFGMMLSDAGYGLIMTLGGLLGAKLLDVGEGAKRLLTMLGISGISTMIWGFIYGGFFGDAIPTIAEVFFGKEMSMPMLIDPLNQPMLVLIMSCALGVVHIFIGMGLKAYLMIKRGDVFGAICDVGLWYVFLIGLPCLLLPGKLHMVGIVMSIVGAVGLVLTQGREKPTIFGKITSGVISLYGVTSYFSDVLSYSRILALGLATGVIASVVNIMCGLVGGGFIGTIAFVVIFIGGHVLNLAINALGSYVHSARLQYVEFFGKYYEGGGKKFDPLRTKTKYVNVTEEK